MTKVNLGTKLADKILWTFNHVNYGSIYEAYGTCSAKKINSWKEIESRARETEGYNHDLKVVARSCHFYSTMYSFTNDEGKFIVYDTAGDTKILKLENVAFC